MPNHLRRFITIEPESTDRIWMPKQTTLYQIKALILLSLLTSIMLFLFATFRIYQGNITLGIAELIATVFYLFSAILLHKKEKFYYLLATIFFVLSYVLLILIFLYLPSSSTPLHWIPTVLVFVFFLLGYRGGVFFLFLYLIFIVYLMLTTSVFSAIEYITWTSSLVILSIIMFFYEKVIFCGKSFLCVYYPYILIFPRHSYLKTTKNII